MRELRVRRARLEDVDRIHAVLTAAGLELAAQGYQNWNPPYPIERLRTDVHERELFVVSEGAVAIATYTLSDRPRVPYRPEPWRDPAVPALYLNRLAVAPRLHGHGVGRWCLQRVAARARERGADAVRCDVLRANDRLRAFYERAGYAARGEREHSGWRFTCYERELHDEPVATAAETQAP